MANLDKERIKVGKLEEIRFDNSSLRELPLDSQTLNFTRQVPNACFSLVEPTPVEKPSLLGFSEEALKLIGIAAEETKREDFAEFFSGNKKIEGSQTAAHCYCGHQFGNFAGQLGDGRAMYIGEIINSEQERWEIQFKGAGLTPFSRSADGRAVLRSSIREFLCSEAMFHLGVPTTRAGTIVTSESFAIRDPLYDGNQIREKCTIVLRIAPSFIRFGSFQVASTKDKYTGAAGPSPKNYKLVKKLLDYVIKFQFPKIEAKNSEDDEKKYTELLEEVAILTAKMVAHWQSVGFAHGVMNTDNMSILGLTIDYGPFGWLEYYDPEYICNHSDQDGRYAFGNQKDICKWNLGKLGESIFVEPAKVERIVNGVFEREFNRVFYGRFREKLGLGEEREEDIKLIDGLLETLEQSCADLTNSLRSLSRMNADSSSEELEDLVQYISKQCADVETFLTKMAPTVPIQHLQMFMKLPADVLISIGKNPAMIPKEMAKHERYAQLSEMTEQEKREKDISLWKNWLNQYKERIHSELNGKSEEEKKKMKEERVEKMNRNNPKFVLRNHLAQDAIESAERGDYSEFWSLFNVLKAPFDEHEEVKHKNYDRLQPIKAAKCVVSCSS